MYYLNELNMHISSLTNWSFCKGFMATMVCETGECTRTFRRWVSLPLWWLDNTASWII